MSEKSNCTSVEEEQSVETIVVVACTTSLETVVPVNRVGLSVVGLVVGLAVVGLSVVGFVVGLAVVGFFVVGFVVVGLAVVGFFVVGFLVVGLAVVGFNVGFDDLSVISMTEYSK